MDSLTQTLNNLRGNIIRLKKRDQPIGEANTKATLIEPLLAALGWNTTNIDEVVREFKLSQRYNPVDYALLLDKKPCLFIEAKALEHSLDDVKWVKQTVNYANNAGVEWCVLTNGDDYHIYRSNAPVSLENKLFRRVKITESYSEAMEVLALLTKENLTKGTLNSQWDTYFARTALKEALVEVLQAPPPALVKAVKEKTSLKPSLIRSLLGDARIDIELPESPSVPSAGKTGRPVKGPWLTDGRTWHLEKRCSPKTKKMLLTLDDLIRNNLEVEGPQWNQKFYVAYRINNYNWLYIETHQTVLTLDFLVQPSAFKQSELAKRLGVEEFDKEQSHFDLPSSVYIEKRSEKADRVKLRIKEDFDIEGKAFLDFLKEAYEAFPFWKE